MCVGILLLLALAQDRSPERVLPVFREFCWDCHAEGSKKGGFSLDRHADLDAFLADRPRWAKAVQLLQSHVMPPVSEPQPSPAQRRALLDWIDAAVFPVDPDRPDPGRSALRRLNRAEFNNAVRDVLHVRSRPADAFPPDDSGYGFDTVGDVLTLSPALLEKVMTAARQAVDEATTPRPVAQVGIERAATKLEIFAGAYGTNRNTITLAEGVEVGVDAVIPQDAVYRVLVVGGPGAVEIHVDGARAATLEFPTKTPFALLPLKTGRHRISLRCPPGGGLPVQAMRVRGPFSPASAPPPPFLAELIGAGRATPTPRLSLSGEDLEAGEGKSSLDTGAAWFSGNGYRRTPLAIREPGRYRFRVKAGGQQAGADPVKFELRVGGKVLGPCAVAAAEQRPEWVELETDLDPGDHELQIHFVNAFKDPASGAERWLWIHEFTLDGPLRDGAGLRHDEVAGLLSKAARRLHRRPLADPDRRRLAELAASMERAGQPPLGALRLGLVALLSSPRFLFWNPPEPAGAPARGSVAIDEFALASRLSAFLWSSVPDETLLALAEAGGLRKALPAQVARMLDDPKARALTEDFAGQWLELRSLPLATPDAATFPGWSPELAVDLRRETEMLFEHVLRENLPVLELLTADYSFLNARLARHYGLPDLEGEAFRKVSLASTPRRGILTHAGLLTLTSHPTRTSPVKRGKFVLEKILGTPPPPAPKDVPPLPEDAPDLKGLSMRRRLEKHRGNKACASCHAFMDPPGFAFEHYDAVGRRRETDEGGPVDSSGRLVTGESFRDAAEFIDRVARGRAEDVVRSLVEQLLTYAVGRGMEYTDKTAIREAVERARPGGWRFRDLLLAVCESVPFQRMRVPEGR